MRIEIHIDLGLSSRQKNIIRRSVVATVVMAVLGVGVALAQPHNFQPTDTLTAQSLNELNVLNVGGTKYSVGATKFCGATATAKNGALGQYTGTKASCQAVAACSTSASAHMCSAEELTRSRALGVAVPDGWYSTGAFIDGINVNDCNGWADGTPAYSAPVWKSGTPSYSACDAPWLTLCCD